MNSEGFIPMLAKLDDCIAYISSHVSHSVLILVKLSQLCVHTLNFFFPIKRFICQIQEEVKDGAL